jgi:hypothetical protein
MPSGLSDLNYRALKKDLGQPALAVGIQLAVAFLFGGLFVGAGVASAFFFGREYSEAKDESALLASSKGVLDPRVWDRHRLLGFLLPAAVTFAIAMLFS